MKKEMNQIIIIGILCFIIAASICVQYRSVHSYVVSGKVAVQSMSEKKLRDEVFKLQEERDNSKRIADERKEEADMLIKNNSTISEETEVLENELSDLKKVLGYTEVKGKGIEITLKDANPDQVTDVRNSVVHDLDVLTVVNELFNAGAEAVSVNNQRIISTSSINCAGNVITINNQKVTVPFEIKAIGPVEGLYGTMRRPYGTLENLSARVDVTVNKVDKEDGITIPKYVGIRQYQYLQSVE